MEDLISQEDDRIVSQQLKDVSIRISVHGKHDPYFIKGLRDALDKAKEAITVYKDIPGPDGKTLTIVYPSKTLLDYVASFGLGDFREEAFDFSQSHLFTDSDLDICIGYRNKSLKVLELCDILQQFMNLKTL